MANESGWKRAAPITLEESGVSTATGVFSQADDVNLTTVNQIVSGTVAHTHCDILLSTGDFTVNPLVGAVVNVYFRPINMEGTEDAPPPSANYKHTFAVALPIDDDQALTQSVKREARLPHPFEECEVWIENQTGQTLSAGWNLRIAPKSYAPATE